MKTKPTLALAALAVAAAGFTASTAQAENRELVSLAHELDRQATQIRREADSHFRHTGQYRHLVADANSLIRVAQHIDELSHNSRRVTYRHFEADVDKAADLVKHLHELVDRMDSGRTGGHSHGNTAHVHRTLRDMSSTVRALQRAVNREYGRGRVSDDFCPYSGRRL